MTTDSDLVFLSESTALRPHGFVHDNFSSTAHPDTEEMRAVHCIEILPYVPLFTHQRQGQDSTTPHALSQMSSILVLLEDSSLFLS